MKRRRRRASRTDSLPEADTRSVTVVDEGSDSAPEKRYGWSATLRSCCEGGRGASDECREEAD